MPAGSSIATFRSLWTGVFIRFAKIPMYLGFNLYEDFILNFCFLIFCYRCRCCFCFWLLMLSFCYRYRRYFGVIVTHYTSAVYSARRTEMVEVLAMTLFYLDRDRPIEIHSPYSDLPLQVINVSFSFIVLFWQARSWVYIWYSLCVDNVWCFLYERYIPYLFLIVSISSLVKRIFLTVIY